MAIQNNMIYAPGTFTDVQQSIGRTVGIDTLAALVADNRINKWAKYKPFRWSDWSVKPVLDQYGYPSSFPELLLANCGLNPNWQSLGRDALIQQVINIYNTGDEGDNWSYARPRGYNNEPYRLTDFVGYRHDALPFIWQNNMPVREIHDRGTVDDRRVIWFQIECFDDRNETMQGMINVTDLQGASINADHLYYCVFFCHPYIMNHTYDTQYVIRTEIAAEPISSIDGRSVSVGMRELLRAAAGSTKNFKCFHTLCRINDAQDPGTWLAMPYIADWPPITDLIIKSGSTPMQIYITHFANVAYNSQELRNLTFQSTFGDISINAWTGLTVRVEVTVSTATPVTVNFSEVYCQTNCHSQREPVMSLYDEQMNIVQAKSITMSSSDGTRIYYMTFANVFDFDNKPAIEGTDVEISVWGEANNNRTIDYETWGNDGTIIYHILRQ